MVNKGVVALLLRPAVRRNSFIHSREICIVTIRVLISGVLWHPLFANLSVIFMFVIPISFDLLPCFQFTAAGAAGLRGLTVTNRATVETRQESACVIILNLLLTGKSAKVRKLKLSLVIWTAVQVWICSMRFTMILYEGQRLSCIYALREETVTKMRENTFFLYFGWVILKVSNDGPVLIELASQQSGLGSLPYIS